MVIGTFPAGFDDGQCPPPLAASHCEPGSGDPADAADTDRKGHGTGFSTILIAEDSDTERLHLKRLLEAIGYKVVAASSGNQARQLAEALRPDVIFLDIIMENGDGYHTCRALKRAPDTSQIPVVMISSKSNKIDVDWAKTLGAIDYILKPYTEAQVLACLERLGSGGKAT